MRAVAWASVFGLAASNFVSPGLEKCMDIERTLKEDGKTRNTIEEMQAEMKKDDSAIINVQLYQCHEQRNQNFEIIGGAIKSQAVGWCLESGRKIEGAVNVRLANCTGADNQQWDFTGYGYVKNKKTGTCLDVQAQKKADGKREKWDDIKKHKTVNLQLYDCHKPDTTRVNQLWEWAPVKGDKVGVQDKFSLGGLNMEPSSGFGHGALALSAVVGSAIMMAGVVVGSRMRRVNLPLVASSDE
jgi:hypothetical protein